METATFNYEISTACETKPRTTALKTSVMYCGRNRPGGLKHYKLSNGNPIDNMKDSTGYRELHIDVSW